MTQMIDPTGFSKDIWGVVFDYAAPNTQDAIRYRITHHSATQRSHDVFFHEARLVAAIDEYYKLGNAFGLSNTRLDKPIRIFAMQTFVVEVPRSINIDEDLVEKSELHLRAYIVREMSDSAREGVVKIYAILQRTGLVSETAGENGKKLYSIVTQADEPTENVKLTKSDVELYEPRERRAKLVRGPDGKGHWQFARS